MSAADRDADDLGLVPQLGQTVSGRYRIDRILGAGGMGFVYEAHDEKLGEPVALKILNPRVAKDPQAVDRLFREARATAKIKNEHVVRVIDFGNGDATTAPYIAMELLVGRDLGQVLHSSPPLSPSQAVDWILQAAEAITEAHALGIVHRDIKPSNLFLSERPGVLPVIKVLDFGISKAITNDDEKSNPNLTDTRAVFGSPTYMSPEQVRSAKRVDHRTDVWALGIVIFELLTRGLPFSAETTAGLLASIVADPPRSLRMLRPDVPEGLEQAVMQCLQKNREHRTQSVQRLAEMLRPFASPIGQASVDVIMRFNHARSSSGSLIPPPQSGSHPLMPNANPFGATERSVVTTNMTIRSRKLPLILAGSVVVAVALLAVGIFVNLHRNKSVTHTDIASEGSARSGSIASPLPVASSVASAPIASAATVQPNVVVVPAGVPTTHAAGPRPHAGAGVKPNAAQPVAAASNKPSPPVPSAAPLPPPPTPTAAPSSDVLDHRI